MPYRYNAITGDLDVIDAASAGAITTINTDSGTVTPVAHEIDVLGGDGITTSGAGNVLTISLVTPVTTDFGGTGQMGLTAGTILVGDGSNPVNLIGPLTDGELLIGDTAGVAPVAASLTAPVAGITITGGAGTITFALSDDLAALEALITNGIAVRTGTSTWTTRTIQAGSAAVTVANGSGVAGDPSIDFEASAVNINDLAGTLDVDKGGTGATSLTDHSVLVGSGTSAITPITVGTDGQILIGASAADPAFADLTSSGSTITVSGGANTLNIDITAPVSVANGGTGATSLTDHGVLIGSGTSAVTVSAVGTDGQIMVGATAADPIFASLTSSGSSITVSGGANTLNIDIAAPVSVANGGTGAITLTDHGILLGSGTSAITPLGAATNGQIPIGSTGADPVLASITGGTGITVTDGAGSITIDADATGDVSGPGSSTDNALARWNGTGGDTLQDSTVIVTDNGEMTNASQPAFLGLLGSADTNATGGGTTYTIGGTTALTEIFDQNGDFTTAGVYTAPIAGKHVFNTSVQLASLSSSMTSSSYNIVTSNRTYVVGQNNPYAVRNTGVGKTILTSSVITEMDALDTAFATITVGGGGNTATVDSGSNATYFGGEMLC